MKYDTKARALRSQNKMTSCEEFFSRMRKLAVTVDRESNELKGLLENSEISAYNENRACLLLRETLAEVKDCKREVDTKVEDVQQRILFRDFISACGRLVKQTKEQIDDLETHLEKYGYIRPKEKLLDLKDSTKPAPKRPVDHKNVVLATSETCHPSSSSGQSDSGDEDIPFENASDSELNTPMETDPPEQTDNKDNPEDLLKSPVPPATFTKMIEVTPQRPLGNKQGTLRDKGQQTPCSTPEAPQTTTPMIKSRLAAKNTDTPTSNFSTAQDSHLPSQPTTVTPMIKPHERVKVLTRISPAPGSPDLPPLPVMGTPGLRALAPPGVDSPIQPELPFCLDSLPPPPDITSVQILRPDDITAPPVQSREDHSRHVFVQPLNEQEYTVLPVYVANQFSMECINHHLNTINTFLLSNIEDHHEPALLEQDLRSLLGLGAATKAFMLALVKTGRLKLAGKNIVFLNTA